MNAPNVTGGKRLARVTRAVNVDSASRDVQEVWRLARAEGLADGYRAGSAAAESIAVRELAGMLKEEGT